MKTGQVLRGSDLQSRDEFESNGSDTPLFLSLMLLEEHPVEHRVEAGTLAHLQNQPPAASPYSRRRRDAGADRWIDPRVRFPSRRTTRPKSRESEQDKGRAKNVGVNGDDDDDNGELSPSYAILTM